MGQIKTNFNTDKKLVLVNDEGNVVAIIKVPKGSDITEQVRLAIKEELIANDVVFQYDIEIEEFDTRKDIDFIYSDEDDEEYSRIFEVILTAEY